MQIESKCECGRTVNYVISPYITTEQRVCKCGRIHWVDHWPVDWNRVSGIKEGESNEKID